MIKRKIKNQNAKKRELKNTDFDFKEFVKKYPGLFIGVILSILIIILAIWSMGFIDEQGNEKLAQAQLIHQNNQAELNYILESIRLMGEDYENDTEKFYANSIENDFLWIKQKDLEIYQSGGRDLYIKQFASFIFINMLFELNQEFISEYYDFDESTIISQAKNVNLTYRNIVFEQIDEIFVESPSDFLIFESTITKLAKEYEANKKEILNGNYSLEEKYIEAKKLLLLSYY